MPKINPDLSPSVGSVVLISYYNGKHEVKFGAGHVHSVAVHDELSASPSGHPAVTVAFLEPGASTTVQLSSARWHEAYRRQGMVLHHTHPRAKEGKVSMVWGQKPICAHELTAQEAGFTIQQPAGDGENPIYERNPATETPVGEDVSKAIATQQGKTPQPNVASPLTSEANKADAPQRGPDPAEANQGENHGEEMPGTVDQEGTEAEKSAEADPEAPAA